MGVRKKVIFVFIFFVVVVVIFIFIFESFGSTLACKLQCSAPPTVCFACSGLHQQHTNKASADPHVCAGGRAVW